MRVWEQLTPVESSKSKLTKPIPKDEKYWATLTLRD